MNAFKQTMLYTAFRELSQWHDPGDHLRGLTKMVGLGNHWSATP